MQHATVQLASDNAHASEPRPTLDRSGCTAEVHGDERAYNRGCRCADAREDHRRQLNVRKLHPRSRPALAAVRMVRALAALGHTSLVIAAASGGLGPNYIRNLQCGQFRTITVRTHWRVAVAYRRLAHKPAAPGRASTQMRNLAARKSWARPDEWLPGELDDPTADPRADSTDPEGPSQLRIDQALDRCLYAADLTRAELDAVITVFRARGVTTETIAVWMRCEAKVIESAVRRLDRTPAAGDRAGVAS